jgi:hypothetical protein
MSSNEIEQNIPADFEKYKFARQKLSEEMMYRRERQWKIFSWISTLLVGITGGVIALNGKDFSFSVLHKIAVTFAVIVLSTFSCIRIYHDSTVALGYSKIISKLDAKQKLKFTDRAYKKWHLGNIGFTILLMLAAIFAVWTSPYVNVAKPTPPSNNSFNPSPR